MCRCVPGRAGALVHGTGARPALPCLELVPPAPAAQQQQQHTRAAGVCLALGRWARPQQACAWKEGHAHAHAHAQGAGAARAAARGQQGHSGCCPRPPTPPGMGGRGQGGVCGATCLLVASTLMAAAAHAACATTVRRHTEAAVVQVRCWSALHTLAPQTPTPSPPPLRPPAPPNPCSASAAGRAGHPAVRRGSRRVRLLLRPDTELCGAGGGVKTVARAGCAGAAVCLWAAQRHAQHVTPHKGGRVAGLAAPARAWVWAWVRVWMWVWAWEGLMMAPPRKAALLGQARPAAGPAARAACWRPWRCRRVDTCAALRPTPRSPTHPCCPAACPWPCPCPCQTLAPPHPSPP